MARLDLDHPRSRLGHEQTGVRSLIDLAKVQDGLGGKARAILAGIGVALVVLTAAMCFVPYPLKMDAKGQLLPQKRALIYTPVPARVPGLSS